jgi:hypothetical protein
MYSRWLQTYQAQQKLAALAGMRRNGTSPSTGHERALLTQTEDSKVDVMAVWYNNQTNRWTEIPGGYVSQVCVCLCVLCLFTYMHAVSIVYINRQTNLTEIPGGYVSQMGLCVKLLLCILLCACVYFFGIP